MDLESSMLSLTIFAVAAQTATQPAAAKPAPPVAREPENVMMPDTRLVETKLVARRKG